jgi:hypothetical protein
MLPASDFFGDKTSCFFDKTFGKFYFSSVNLINFADFWKTWPIVYFTKLGKKKPCCQSETCPFWGHLQKTLSWHALPHTMIVPSLHITQDLNIDGTRNENGQLEHFQACIYQ